MREKKEIGAPIAGEMSGHIFFADGYYGYDDALYAAVRLLDYVAKKVKEAGLDNVATVLGGDLTHEYVSENADYRS